MNPAKLVVRAAGLCQAELERTHYAVFGTVTYRPGAEWSAKQISTLMQHYRSRIQRIRPGTKVPYIWVLEPQENGRPHYHFIIWVPNGIRCPKPDAQGWWPHGMSNVQLARNPARYLGKYIGKNLTPLRYLPRHRSYAVQVKNPWLSRLRLPAWMQYVSRVGERWRMVAKMGGYCNADTGVYWPSPWRIWPGEWGAPHWVGWGGTRPVGGVCNLEAWCRVLGEIA